MNDIKFANKILYLDHLDIKIFLYIQALSFLFFFPILYGAHYYADDLFRVTSGFYGWDNLGRYLANYIAKLYSLGNSSIIDPMPFGTIFNIFIIGLSSYLIYLKLKETYGFPAFIISSLFIVNPFLVDNLLYRFDSIGMVLSLFFVVFSFSLKDLKLTIILKITSLLISLNFYQTFSNLYIGLVAIELLTLTSKNKNHQYILRFMLLNLFIFLTANVIYFIEMKIIGMSNRGEMLEIGINLPYLIYKNITSAFNTFYSFWSYSPAYLFVVFPFIIISICKALIKSQYTFIIGVIISSLLIAFSGIGFMSMLKTQFLQPRGLAYFPIILMAFAIIIRFTSKYAMIVMLAPVFACFIFVSKVGNIHSIQVNFEQPILFSISKDIYHLESKGVNEFYSRGAIPFSKYIENIRKSTPFNGYMYRDGWVATGRIHEYGNDSVKIEWSSDMALNKFNPKEKGMVLSVDSTPFYKIYTSGNKGWIVWGN